MASNETYDSSKPLGAFSALNTYHTYSWISNEHFYGLIPTPYKDYYQRFVKRSFHWYDGFVPYFHTQNSGMFSTRIAYTIAHTLAQRVVGNKLMFDDEGKADKVTKDFYGTEVDSLELIEAWSKHHNLDTKTVLAEEYALAGGDAIIKLDSDGKDLIPSVLRKDSYLISTDFRGKISEFQGFIYSYSRIAQVAGQDKQREYFYLLEERQYTEKGQPQFRLSMKRGTTNLTNMKPTDISEETVDFKSLPRNIRHQFKRDYPQAILGEWVDMDLPNIGIFIVKASENVSLLPTMSGGESIFNNSIHSFMAYDFYYSSFVSNMYTARDKLFISQIMQGPDKLQEVYGSNYNQGWDAYIQSKVPYVSPEEQTPTIWQPSLRADDWARVRSLILQTIAMDLGVDERTLSASIVPNSEKPTAREISSDEHTTTLFVEHKQRLLKNALDEMLDTVLWFFGFGKETVTVKFSRAGLQNLTNVTTITSVLKQNGLIDRKTALEMIFVDKNDAQIEAILAKIIEEEERAMERSKEQEADVEENIEQTNNTDVSHVQKK